MASYYLIVTQYLKFGDTVCTEFLRKLSQSYLKPRISKRWWYSCVSQSVSSVAQSCPTLCDPMNHSTPGLPVHHQLRSSLRLRSIESVMPYSHLSLCRPLLLLPPIPPSIRVFSNESTLGMRWPKDWSFSLSISPSSCVINCFSKCMLSSSFYL